MVPDGLADHRAVDPVQGGGPEGIECMAQPVVVEVGCIQGTLEDDFQIVASHSIGHAG
jgi:hypothetical protein